MEAQEETSVDKLHWQCKYGECEAPKLGNTDYCGTHLHGFRKMKRDALKPKKVTEIKKVSNKRQKENKTYSILRKEQLEEFPNCQIKLEGCEKIATEVHHSAKRGKNYLNKETFLSACHHCHVVLETKISAKVRREKGLLK
jgi:hypothetical protein